MAFGGGGRVTPKTLNRFT